MKQLYFLFLAFLISSFSWGQTIFSDNFNYLDNSLLTDNLWTAHSGAGTQPIDVGAGNGLVYSGYSDNTGTNNAARLDNTGEDVNKSFTAVTSGNLYMSFLVNVTTGTAGYFAHIGPALSTSWASRIFVKPSVNLGKINFGISNTSTASYAASPTDYDLNTTYLIVVKYNVSATGAASMWVLPAGIPATEIDAGTPEHTTSGSGQASIGAFYLRQYSSTQNITVDDVKIFSTWFGTTPCDLSLGTSVRTCDAITLNIDTYNVSIPFTGGGTGTYNLAVNAGTVGGDNPNSNATGNITISNIPEGTNVTLTVTGSCSFTKDIISPECKPINTLPYYENFNYTIGHALGSQQKWTNDNSGDEVLVIDDNLSYTGLTPTGGKAVQFDGVGIDPRTPFTATSSGSLYTSFLFKVKDFAGVADTGGGYVFALADDTGYLGRVFVKRNGTQFQIGFSETSTPTYDATLYNTNETIFVVISYDFATTTYKMWVNPPVNSLGSTTPTFEVTGAVTADLGNFYLRQDSSGNTPTIVFDELRIATEEAKVLDVVKNEITNFALYPNPVKGGKVFINSANPYAERTVQVFDVLGKQVVNQHGTQNSVDVSHLNKGIYIMKVAEEGKVATRKLVIE